ncbi:hypothetical protein GALL_324010 [mine drainage metagenome]|uniref:Uncharacterized protein n=1 Tax=mine drainage metagenome TaxID=410659 RepID=A0A1J5R7R8_9ZZZZ
MSDENRPPGAGRLGAGPYRAAWPARALGAGVLGLVVTLALSACGSAGHAPGSTGPAAAVAKTAASTGSAPTGTLGTAAPDAQSSPATATISQNDVTELHAALGDAESLANDVESDMAKDTSQ